MSYTRHVQEDGTLDLRGIVHVKNNVYYNNEFIKKVIIGSSVQTIGVWAFNNCTNLSELLFEEPCQITKLERACFANCFRLKKIELPVSIQEIDSYAFYLCPLETVILRGPCCIGAECFQMNKLTYIHISDTIQTLGRNIFYQYPHYYYPLSRNPCKIYIRPEFHGEIKRMFYERAIEFIGNELEEGHVLK